MPLKSAEKQLEKQQKRMYQDQRFLLMEVKKKQQIIKQYNPREMIYHTEIILKFIFNILDRNYSFSKALLDDKKDIFELIVCYVYKLNLINLKKQKDIRQGNKIIVQLSQKLHSRPQLKKMIQNSTQLTVLITYLASICDKQSLNQQKEWLKMVINGFFSQIINFQTIIKFSQSLSKQRQEKLISKTQVFNKMNKFLLLFMQINFAITLLISLEVYSLSLQKRTLLIKTIIEYLSFQTPLKKSKEINLFLKNKILDYKQIQWKEQDFFDKGIIRFENGVYISNQQIIYGAKQVQHSLLGYNFIPKLRKQLVCHDQQSLKFSDWWDKIVNYKRQKFRQSSKCKFYD